MDTWLPVGGPQTCCSPRSCQFSFFVAHTLCRQVSSSVVELISLALWPRVETTNVHDNLAIWSYIDMGAIHRSWSRTFEVDSLAVIAAPMTRALEFVFRWLPIGCTAQVRPARVDDKKSIGCTIDPNSVFLQKFLVDTLGIVDWIPNLEHRSWFKQHTRQEEPKERNEPRGQKGSHAAPNKPSPSPVDNCVGGSDGGNPGRGGRFRSSDCGSADVLRGVGPGGRLSCGCDERLFSTFAFSLHVFHRCFVSHGHSIRTISTCRP